MDNNSTDGSLEMARGKYSRAIFIKNEQNLGYAAGNNLGIRYALERAGLIPYLLTIIIMTGIIGKTIPPAADGTPYEK